MVIEIENLVKRYHDLIALDHFNLQVKESEIFGLLGPNGSGKTTSINCLLSLLKFDKGTIRIFGKEMTPTSYDIKKEIGVVFQNVAVFEELSVYENIDYFCGLYISDKQKRRQLVQEAIDFVSLNDFVKFKPKKLSGGLLRRLNIACGIAHKPKLIILDEPTVAVDPQSRNNILEGIKKLNKEGATILYTSHYMDEVEKLCDHIAIMDNGKVIAKGTKDELKNMISSGETISIEVEELPKEILVQIEQMENVNYVQYENNIVTIRYKKDHNNLIQIVTFLNEHHIQSSKIHSELPTLNDVFLELTGKALRD